MMKIWRYIKPALRYAAMPGIVPRLKRFDLRFPFIAYLIAQIYAAVRLLPASHAYLNPANTGTYGIGQVVMAAMDRLRESRALDQVIVFAIISVALVLLIGQFAMLVLMLGIDTAQAASGAAFTSMFDTPQPEKDIALMMLDLVFGVPGIFGSEHAPAGPGDINPFHQGMHELFKLYSYGVLVLGGVILLYYLFAVVLETAQTGTPFGQRFDHIYAPLRLVIAIGLLIPLHYGLNAGQHLTLNLAKWGSGLATNGWIVFHDTLSQGVQDHAGQISGSGDVKEYGHAGGLSQSELLAKPEPRNIGELVRFFYLANMCAHHYEVEGPPRKEGEAKGESEIYPLFSYDNVKPYLVRNQASVVSDNDAGETSFNPEGTYKHVDAGLDFGDALKFYNYGDVTIRFGHKSYSEYPHHKGGVKPLCGEITISVDSINQAGAFSVYENYFKFIRNNWTSTPIRRFAKRYYKNYDSGESLQFGEEDCQSAMDPTDGGVMGPRNFCFGLPQPGFVQNVINNFQAQLEAGIRQAREDFIDNGTFGFDQAMKERGWGGAAIWFNDIAAANGSFFSAVYNIPDVRSYPHIMQKTADNRLKTTNIEPDSVELFKPNYGEGSGSFSPDRLVDKQLTEAGHALLVYFDSGSIDTGADTPSGNVFHDLVNMLLGTQGLFSIRDNREIHPLAQMTAMGRSMIDTSIRNFAVGAAAATLGDNARQASTSVISMAFIGITLGFILHYILPFLPFIYFFFAVSNWVKEVFEAMVGMPLWAIAHLQLEGKGLPGSAAGEGYFLLLGIFLRPILILFGLIASIAIFSAQAIILHDVFDLVVANLTGHGGSSGTDGSGFVAEGLELARSSLDEFFYTVLYVIILYLMATASFKLVDAIPESILRWAGSDAKPFSDNQDDPADNLVRNIAIGSRMALQQPLTQATAEFGQTASGAVGGAFRGAGGLINSMSGSGTTIGNLGRGIGR